MHVPAACAVDDTFHGNFQALGDFTPPPGSLHLLSDIGADLGVPASARAIVLDVFDTNSLKWGGGLASVADKGDVDLLILPREPCALSQPSSPLTSRTNPALGAIDARHLLVAGGAGIGTETPHSFVADLSTGTVTALATGLTDPRADATVTPFGDPGGALVAGGTKPETGEVLQTAEVYVPPGASGASPALTGPAGDFDGAPIPLSTARARQGAIALATGETLLVGGFNNAGAAVTLVKSLEVVDPKHRQRGRVEGLDSLIAPRIRPTVLRLASGEILVAGGSDESGQPIVTNALEWLAPDAHAHSGKRPRDLVAGKERAFVALPGGGALAVVVPEAQTAASENVWVISADGDVQPAAPIRGALEMARLFPGTEGAPLLWTGDRWLRWRPWQGDFFSANGLDTVRSGPAAGAFSSSDVGLALWLGDDATGVRVVGMRFDTRGPYATENPDHPLLVDGPDLFAPDRLAGTPSSAIRFDASLGLVLEQGTSAFLTDATLGSFTLDLDVPNGIAPRVLLRDERGTELEVGGASCLIVGFPGTHTLHVARDGSSIVTTLDDGVARACPAPLPGGDSGRISVGLRGAPAGPFSTARRFVLQRR
jgi:hypothetical protein